MYIMCAPRRTNGTPAHGAGILYTGVHSTWCCTHVRPCQHEAHRSAPGRNNTRQHRAHVFNAQYCTRVRTRGVQAQASTRRRHIYAGTSRTHNIHAGTRRTHAHAHFNQYKPARGARTKSTPARGARTYTYIQSKYIPTQTQRTTTKTKVEASNTRDSTRKHGKTQQQVGHARQHALAQNETFNLAPVYGARKCSAGSTIPRQHKARARTAGKHSPTPVQGTRISIIIFTHKYRE